VVALRLGNAVDVDGDRPLGVRRQPDAAAGGDAALGDLEFLVAAHVTASRTASKGESPAASLSGSLRITPAKGTSAPSPMRSMPAARRRSRPPADSSRRACTRWPGP